MNHLDRALGDIVKQTEEEEKTVRGRGALKAGMDERRSGGGAFRRKTFVKGSTPYDLGNAVRKMDEKWEHDLFEEGGEEEETMDAGEPASYGGKVKITNLASTVTEADLKGIFGEAGVITKVVINYGNAEIYYSKMKEAVEASRTFNNISLEGRDIVVTLVAKSGSSSGSSGRRTGSSSSGGLRMVVGKGGRVARLTHRPASQSSSSTTVHRITGLGGMGVYEGVGGQRDRRQAPRRTVTGFRAKSLVVSKSPSGVRKVKKTTKEDLDADLDSIMSTREN